MTTRLTPDPIVYGDYRVLTAPDGQLQVLGRGAFGITYLAESKKEIKAALKVIHPHLVSDAKVRERFNQEAREHRKLNHPGIARLLDYGNEKGHLYYALEYCSGGTLGQLIARSGPMPVSEMLHLIRQAADALLYAHGYGMIHRDLKPDNLMLAEEVTEPGLARLKIIDFGLVKRTQEAAGLHPAHMSQSAGFRGTFSYASPEQVREEKLTPSSDIFSLGMTAWYMLHGSYPIENSGNAVAVIQERTSAESYAGRLPAHLPPFIRDMIARMLEKDVQKRYKLCRELLDDIDEAIEKLESWDGQADAGAQHAHAQAKRAKHSGALPPLKEFYTHVIASQMNLGTLYDGHDLRTREPVELLALIRGLDRHRRAEVRETVRRLEQHPHDCILRLTWLDAREGSVIVRHIPGWGSLLERLRELKRRGTLSLSTTLPVLTNAASAFDHAASLGLCGMEFHPGKVYYKPDDDAIKLSPRLCTLFPEADPAEAVQGTASLDESSTEADGPAGISMTSQFAAFVYWTLSGTAPPGAAFVTPDAYRMIPGLHGAANNILKDALCGAMVIPCVTFLRTLFQMEGVTAPLPATAAVPVFESVSTSAAGTGSTVSASASRTSMGSVSTGTHVPAGTSTRLDMDLVAQLAEELEEAQRAIEEARKKAAVEREQERQRVEKELEQMKEHARQEAERRAAAELEQRKQQAEIELREKDEARRLAHEKLEEERRAREEERLARLAAEQAVAKAHQEAELRAAAHADAERLRKEEEARRITEVERLRKEEEAKRIAEVERLRKEEETKRLADFERLRREQEAQQREQEEKHRRALELQRQNAEMENNRLKKEAEQRAAAHAEAERLRKEEEARRTQEMERLKKEQEEKLRRERQELERQTKLKEEAQEQKHREQQRLLEKERKEREAAARRAEEAEKKMKAVRAAQHGPAWKRWAAVLAVAGAAGAAAWYAVSNFSKKPDGGGGSGDAPAVLNIRISAPFRNSETSEVITGVKLRRADMPDKPVALKEDASGTLTVQVDPEWAGKEVYFDLPGYKSEKAPAIDPKTGLDLRQSIPLRPEDNLSITWNGWNKDVVRSVRFTPASPSKNPGVTTIPSPLPRQITGAAESFYLNPAFDYSVQATVRVSSYFKNTGEFLADGSPKMEAVTGEELIELPLQDQLIKGEDLSQRRAVTVTLPPSLPPKVELSGILELPLCGIIDEEKFEKDESNRIKLQVRRKLYLTFADGAFSYTGEGEGARTLGWLCTLASYAKSANADALGVVPPPAADTTDPDYPDKMLNFLIALGSTNEALAKKNGNHALKRLRAIARAEQGEEKREANAYINALAALKKMSFTGNPADFPKNLEFAAPEDRSTFLQELGAFRVRRVSARSGYLIDAESKNLKEKAEISGTASTATALEWTPQAGFEGKVSHFMAGKSGAKSPNP